MAASGSRPLKRQRLSDFLRGSVMKVEVKNFMTYKHAIIKPGPKLNLVLGPNGTGKSSLVCAICVGLAGKTHLLGRAEDVSSFVRKGTSSGWVEITLAGDDPMRPHVIRREINAADNSSHWYINKQSRLMKEVEALVRDNLKIQLDNLCQFLPQDKVVEFARMKPVDLLEATEKAIGNGELFEQHKQLVEERRLLAEQDHEKEALEVSLGQLRAENERSTRDVQNIQRREQLLEEVELAQKKVPWAQFYAKRAVYEQDKERRDDAKAQLHQLQQARTDDEGPLAEKEALLKGLQAQRTKLQKELRNADAKLAGADGRPGLDDEMTAALEESTSKEAEVKSLEHAAAEREEKRARLERDIEVLSTQVAALPPLGDTGEWGPQRQQLFLEQKDLSTQDSSLAFEIDTKKEALEALARSKRQAEEKLRRIDDSKMRRLQALEQRYRGIGRAWSWLQANRGRFRCPVFGPIAIEVECPDPQHVKYLEQQVGAQVWAFFVTQHRDDHDLLKHEFENNLHFSPAISNYQGDPNEPIPHPRGEASEYARYGVSQTLDRVFTAPNIVKRVLCDESRIHEAYVGDVSTPVDKLFHDSPRIQLVYTPQASYKRTRSQYNSAAESTLVSDIRLPRVLTGAAATDEGQERADAEAEIQRCTQEAVGLQREIGDLAAQRKDKADQLKVVRESLKRVDAEIQAATRRHQAMHTRLKDRQGQLERLRKQPDPRKREPKLRQEMMKAQERAVQKALELARVQTAQLERLVRYTSLDLGVREAAMQVERIRDASRARQEAVARMQAIVDQLVEGCKRTADECRRLKQKAEQNAELTEDLKEQWDALPEGEADLLAFIEEKMVEADAMLIANPAALRQYNERCHQISDQERQLAALEERRQLARATIDDVAGRWLPRLKEVVASINAIFSENFQSVGCAGDVVLHEAPEEDFEHYAIEIRVKFRDSEELHTLDANRQSGGERSVSTVLYLIALQSVTVTPFRVVDEINQGMDPVNERKVYMQLVDAACRDGTPQCFLLTPKLLPDLPFTPDVTVLQIMNGSHVNDVAVGFTMEKLLGSARMQALAAA